MESLESAMDLKLVSKRIRFNNGPMTVSNRMRTWTVILIGWILFIIVLCSFPWWVESPQWGRVRWIPLLDVLRWPHPRVLRDAIANFILYIPLGFAYARARVASGGKLVGEATLVGLLLSMTCELYQVFSPVRFPSMTDVLTNSLGALAGASVVATTRKTDGRPL